MPEREHHFRGRKDKDVQRRMITPLLAGARKGFLEKMLYEHGQRRGGDGTTHKRHGQARARRREVHALSEKQQVAWFDWNVARVYLSQDDWPHVLLHMRWIFVASSAPWEQAWCVLYFRHQRSLLLHAGTPYALCGLCSFSDTVSSTWRVLISNFSPELPSAPGKPATIPTASCTLF